MNAKQQRGPGIRNIRYWVEEEAATAASSRGQRYQCREENYGRQGGRRGPGRQADKEREVMR